MLTYIWGIEVEEVSKGTFLCVKVDFQDPGGQDNVKLRLPFALRKVSSLRQLTSWRVTACLRDLSMSCKL